MWFYSLNSYPAESRVQRQTKRASHAVAGKYFLAALAQLGPVLLQTLLNRAVIAQLLPAKALCISRAGLLLLRRTPLTLC